MGIYIAFLRAINVGGTGKLPMADLRALCTDLGLEQVQTHIQSGNVVFSSRKSQATVQSLLEEALAQRIGKPVGVFLRTPSELETLLAHNPFPEAAPNRVLIYFLPHKPPASAIAKVPTPDGEELALQGRELFIHFPNGMGQSKLKVPYADSATGRNLNTVTKMWELSQALET